MRQPAVVTCTIGMSVALVTAVSYALVFWTLPVADDYCRANLHGDWLAYAVEMYQVWNGRWAAMAIDAALLPRMDLLSIAYPLSLAVLYASCLFAFYTVIRLLFPGDFAQTHSVLLALAMSALYWAGMPAPGETVYWLSGAIEYTLPLVLLIFALRLVVTADSGPPGGIRAAQLFAACLLALLVTGLHEIAAVVLTFLLAMATGTALALKRRVRYSWSPVFLVAVAGTLLSLLAPGHDVRMRAEHISTIDATQHLSLAVIATARQVQNFLLPWITDVKLLAASVLLIASPWFRKIKPPWTCQSTSYWKILLPFVWMMSMFVIFVMVAWGIRTVGPDRLYNFAYGVFLTGWFVSLFIWSRGVHPELDGEVSDLVRKLAGLILSVSLLTSPNMLRAVGDFVGEHTVMRYTREMRARYDLLRRSKAEGKREVILTSVPRIPESFFQRDVETDPAHWRNKCVADYFGLAQIRR